MRKSKPKKRYLQPDPVFSDEMVSLFVNNLMYAIEQVNAKAEEGTTGIDTWRKALANVSPSVEVKSKRIGGSNFQIPMEVRPSRKISLGMKWLILFSRKRNGKTMADKLAQEIIAASKGEGAAYKKREDVHRMAEANKAFAHFR
jgi:small subunit ribosomal protein S7